MGADDLAWVPPVAGAARALPVALTPVGQARAREHDKDLGGRLTGQAVGLFGRDAVLTIIGRRHARKLADCGAPAWEQVIDLAGAGDAGIGTVIPIRDHEYVCEDRAAVIRTGEVAGQIAADGYPEVYGEGFWSGADACAGRLGLTGPAGMVRTSEVPGAG